MKWATESTDSQPTQHSEGQSVTPEHGAAVANVLHAGIKSALAKKQWINAMDDCNCRCGNWVQH